jgi:hypothetical protein
LMVSRGETCCAGEVVERALVCVCAGHRAPVLVPLSHYLQWSISDLKRSFLNPAGLPLLRHGRYASRVSRSEE